MTPTLNLTSRRARLARYGGAFSAREATIVVIISSILFAAGLLLLGGNQKPGYSLLGLSIPGFMTWLWRRWQLEGLPPAEGVEKGSLDAVLEPKLLAKFKSVPSPAAVWQAALSTWEGVFVAERLLVPAQLIGDLLKQKQNQDTSDPLAGAAALARQFDVKEIDGGLVVAAVLLLPAMSDLRAQVKMRDEEVMQAVGWLLDTKEAINNLKFKPYFGGVARDWASGYTPALSKLAHNLSDDVEKGYYRHLPPAHETIVDQMAVQLAGSRPRVALVGDIGVGKTSLVYRLAEKLIMGQGESLKYYKIMALDASVLVSSGAQLEPLLMRVMGEAAAARNIILFLDEAQLFFGSGTGAVDLGNFMLNILQRSNIKVILAFNSNSWQTFSAANPSLSGLLQRLIVKAPSRPDAIRIMQDAAIGIEHSTGTRITVAAINEAYKMAERYLPETAFPGKGVTLLEQASHMPVAAKLITAASVQQAVEQFTGVKVVAAGIKEQKQLLNLETEIHKRMVNQTQAVKAVANALRRSRAGVSGHNRPVGSFLFLGPTGVGKTELAKSLAAVYFGGEGGVIRLDMSEYQQPSDATRILAPTPQRSVGTSLVAAIRRSPFSVVLLDEIEKSHPEILNLLLQVLDEGRLTDSDGRQVSFKDAIVICTSNAGAAEIISQIEQGGRPEDIEVQIKSWLLKSGPFRPELLNRFDEIVMFKPLSKPELSMIAELMLGQVNANLKDQGLTVEIDSQAKAFLVEQGFDPKYGARPMRRVIQRAVENVVAKKILSGSVSAGSKLVLSLSDLQSEDS